MFIHLVGTQRVTTPDEFWSALKNKTGPTKLIVGKSATETTTHVVSE